MIGEFMGQIDGIRILQNPDIPDYVYKQIFIPRSKKKRIVMKCRKKYTISVINDYTFWLDNTSIICSKLMWKTFLKLKIWRRT